MSLAAILKEASPTLPYFREGGFFDQNPLLKKALLLADILHDDQKARFDGSYVSHVRRVCFRLYEEFGIEDSDTLIAGALHDSLEDQEHKLAEIMFANGYPQSEDTRSAAQHLLTTVFGGRVAQLVTAVTNLPVSPDMSVSEKNQKYVDHIQEVIKDVSVFYIKLSDFLDNGTKLDSVTDPIAQVKLAQKYFPLYGILIRRMKEKDVAIKPEVKNKIILQLTQAQKHARGIIKSSKQK